MSPAAELLAGRSVCICAGSGGVGKTTTSAALALGMAARGLRACVVTIDPARRLADSLGLEELGNEPRQVDPARLEGHGIDLKGELWALMLDPKRTFDDLIARLAPDERSRDEVLANRIYQQLSGAIAGSQEYTAVARLYDLHREGGFDVIVLDTPPSRHALDFLDAPDRLTQFLEGRAMGTLLRPTGAGMRIVGRGGGVAFGLLRKVTGIDLLADLSAFFGSLGGMLEGFQERARHVDALLSDPGTTFLIVTSPEAEPISEALHFREKLRENDLPYGGTIVNRVHSGGVSAAEAEEALPQLTALVGEELAGDVIAAARDAQKLALRDARHIAGLQERLGGGPILEVPQLGPGIHDVDGLVAVHAHLFA